MSRRLRPTAVAGLAALLALPLPALAQDDDDGGGGFGAADGPEFHLRLLGGAAWAPDYLGSDDSEVQPYFEGSATYGEYYAKLRGSRLRVNVIDDPNWHAGPFVAYQRDRNEVEDPRVEALDGIDPAIEVGGFIEYEHSIKPEDPRYAERVRLTVRQDVADAHGGTLATLRGTIQRPILRPLVGAVSVSATWASSDYMDTYFGVSPAESARSGLTAYDAGSGLRSLGIAVALNQFLSREWSVTGRVAYTRLMGDAADSPVVAEAGSANQVFVTLGVGYRF